MDQAREDARNRDTLAPDELEQPVDFPIGSRVRLKNKHYRLRGTVTAVVDADHRFVTYDKEHATNIVGVSHHIEEFELLGNEPESHSLPAVGGFVQLPQSWDSSAGKIQNLVEHTCGGVGIIHSRKFTVRANHHHLNDFHYLYCLSGSFQYAEWPVGGSLGDNSALRLDVGPGQMIFTPPMRNHKLIFGEDTVMISISKLSRTHAEHESDVVRL